MIALERLGRLRGRRRWSVSTRLVLFAAAALAVGPADACDRLAMAARGAAEHLRSIQEPGGMFPYGFDFAARSPIAGDNIVRRAAAAFSLAEYYAHTKDSALRPSLTAAVEALASRSIAVADGALVSADGSAEGALTGATALALLAELHFFRTSGDGRYAEIRDAWKRGLRAVWLPSRGFRATPVSSEASDYFNGEIWLALAYLHATTEEVGLDGWLVQVDSELMAIYDHAPAIGFYHWGVMAAFERYAHSGDRRFRDFALRQTRAFLDVLRPDMHPQANTCYSLEGLLTARRLVENDATDPLRTDLDRRIEPELEKNLRLQIDPDQPLAPRESGGSFAAVDLERYRGAFLAGLDRPYTRIDHTQHCLAALIRAERLRSCPVASADRRKQGRSATD